MYAKLLEKQSLCDIVDYSDFLKKISFYSNPPSGKLHLKDKEFDYIILSHVMEHVPNLLEFKNEIEGIAKSDYIELPTKLNDNLVFGCDEEVLGHKWFLNLMMIINNFFTPKRMQLKSFFL